MLKRAGRRLLVSPWFAAGAGVVIAAGALLYAPHAHFAIGISKCDTLGGASCQQMTQQGVAPALVGGDQMTPSPSPSSTPARTTILYQPVQSSTGSTGSGFSIWIKIPSPPGRWSLSFVIPGASDIYLYGWPRYQRNGPDGITVTSNYAGTESAGYAAFSGYEPDGSGELSAGGVLVPEFDVRGTGAPSTPSNCYFNGKPCQFKLSTNLASGAWPGSG